MQATHFSAGRLGWFQTLVILLVLNMGHGKSQEKVDLVDAIVLGDLALAQKLTREEPLSVNQEYEKFFLVVDINNRSLEVLIQPDRRFLTAVTNHDKDNPEEFKLLKRRKVTPLFVAIRYERLEITKFLLKSGANPNSANPKLFDGYLHLALELQNNSLAEALLSIDATNPNQPGCISGQTPLVMAIVYRNIEAAKLLLKEGANPNIPVSSMMRQDDKLTPLHILCLGMRNDEVPRDAAIDQEILKLLLSKSADVNEKTTIGHTALDFATHLSPTLVPLLKKAGGTRTSKEDKWILTLKPKGKKQEADLFDE